MWLFFSHSSFVYVWQLWVAFIFLVCFAHLGWCAILMPLRRSGEWRQRAPKQSCASNRTSCVALCSLLYQSAWPLFFHFTSSRWLTSLLSHSTRCLFSILFLLKQTNKSELTCHHKLWVILAQIFSSILMVRSMRFIQRRSSEKMSSQFKSLWPIFILGIDSGIDSVRI